MKSIWKYGCALMLSLAAAGCSASKLPPSGKASPSMESITMMNVYYDADLPDNQSVAIEQIQEYTGVKLDITWIPFTAYTDKVNAAVASGQAPEALLVLDFKTSAIISAVRSEMFWEIGPYINQYPNLRSLSAGTYRNTSIDGKLYGLFRYRPPARYGIIYRRDWLDRLGMQEPSTMEELYKVIEAFAKADPDQNGFEDTWGYAADFNIDSQIAQAAVYLGAPNGWGVIDGRMTPDFITPEFKQALQFFRSLFQEKLMNQDFTVVSLSQKIELVNSGQAGLYFGPLDDAVNKHVELSRLNPNAKMDVILNIKGPMGERIKAEPGYNGVFLFPTTSVKSTEALQEILRFFDKLGDPPMVNLFCWGLEERHYTMKDGIPVRTSGQASLFSVEINPLRQLYLYSDKDALAGVEDPLTMKYKRLYQENEGLAVPDASLAYISPTHIKKGADMQKLLKTGIFEYILGNLDDEGWDAVIKQWMEMGGSQLIADYTQAYQNEH